MNCILLDQPLQVTNRVLLPSYQKFRSPCHAIPIGHANIEISLVSQSLPGLMPPNGVESSPPSSARINPPCLPSPGAAIVQWGPLPPLRRPLFTSGYIKAESDAWVLGTKL